ncbi:MAG: hypothetical protein ACD_79C00669G0003 [uncultured bacterium]|nr:MAG: hypothetical protein ACD_79C00669G0003 [uncultured bacterium]
MGDFFKLTYVENTGAAFGQFAGQNEKLFIITVVFLIFLGIAIFYSKSNKWELAGFLCIFAGAIGNAADRLFKGHVIDFLDFDFFDIHLKSFGFIEEFDMMRWPVFNFADSYICIGVGLVILSNFLVNKLGTPITIKE